MPKFNGSSGGVWIAFALILSTGFVLSCIVGVSAYVPSGRDENLLQSYNGIGVKDVVGPLMTEILKLRSQLVRLDSTLERKDAHIRYIENELMDLREGRRHPNSAVEKDDAGWEEMVAGDGDESKSLSNILEAKLEAMTARARQLEQKVVTATRKSEQDYAYAQVLKRRAQVAEQNAADLQFEHKQRSQAFK